MQWHSDVFNIACGNGRIQCVISNKEGNANFGPSDQTVDFVKCPNAPVEKRRLHIRSCIIRSTSPLFGQLRMNEA